jgi:dolichol-phosphate mannosyltransferase
MSEGDLLIMIPTFNERENVEELCRQVLALGLGAHLLFVDDHSPDGTGQVLDRLAKEHPCVEVMHRPGKLGIGGAHLDGIAWAYDRGYRTLVTMDCDFTHSPSDIPRIIETLGDGDVAVGSRFLQPGSLAGWSFSRKVLTRMGHFVTRYVLGNPYDASGAFRAYRLGRVPREAFGLVRARGYAFFAESLLILYRNGLTIRELPICLPARAYGHSKMSLREIIRGLRRLGELWLESRLHPGRFLLPKE